MAIGSTTLSIGGTTGSTSLSIGGASPSTGELGGSSTLAIEGVVNLANATFVGSSTVLHNVGFRLVDLSTAGGSTFLAEGIALARAVANISSNSAVAFEAPQTLGVMTAEGNSTAAIEGIVNLGNAPMAGDSTLSGQGRAIAEGIAQLTGESILYTFNANSRNIELSGGSILELIGNGAAIGELGGSGVLVINNALAIGEIGGSSLFVPEGWGLSRFPPWDVWPGVTCDGTKIYIDIDEIPYLTAAAADAATGDWRTVMHCLLAQLHDVISEPDIKFRTQAIYSFKLDDKNYNNSDFGDFSNIRRQIRMSFLVSHIPTDVVEEP